MIIMKFQVPVVQDDTYIQNKDVFKSSYKTWFNDDFRVIFRNVFKCVILQMKSKDWHKMHILTSNHEEQNKTEYLLSVLQSDIFRER